MFVQASPAWSSLSKSPSLGLRVPSPLLAQGGYLAHGRLPACFRGPQWGRCSSCTALSQVPSIQNNQYAKVPCWILWIPTGSNFEMLSLRFQALRCGRERWYRRLGLTSVLTVVRSSESLRPECQHMAVGPLTKSLPSWNKEWSLQTVVGNIKAPVKGFPVTRGWLRGITTPPLPPVYTISFPPCCLSGLLEQAGFLLSLPGSLSMTFTENSWLSYWYSGSLWHTPPKENGSSRETMDTPTPPLQPSLDNGILEWLLFLFFYP